MGSRDGFQEVPVGESFFHISARQPGVFASQAFRARSLAVFDGVDNRPVMLFPDGGHGTHSGQSFGQEHA
jgi:hypothetical protein